MNDNIINILTITVPIVTSLITYFGLRYQAKIDLQKLQEQSKNQLDTIKTEFLAYAETYEKNKQTDATHDLFLKLFTDTSDLDNFEKNLKKFIKFGDTFQGNQKSPVHKRR